MIEDKVPYKSITINRNWDGEVWATTYERYGTEYDKTGGGNHKRVDHRTQEYEIGSWSAMRMGCGVTWALTEYPDDFTEEELLLFTFMSFLFDIGGGAPPKPEGYYDE